MEDFSTLDHLPSTSYPRPSTKKQTLRSLFSLRLLGYSKQKIPPKELFRPEKFNLSSGAQVKPCRSGLRTGWVTHRGYRLKGPYVVLSFLLLLFCVLCGIIVNSVLKSRFSIISASGFRKGKKTKNKYGPVQFARKLLFFGP